jgi:CRISPR-associated endonuclease/helicase Cas3
MWLAGLHDLGKICPGFQHRPNEGLEVPPEYSAEGAWSDHALAGQLWLGWSLYQDCGWSGKAAVRAAEIVGGHHGLFSTFPTPEYSPSGEFRDKIGKGPWESQRAAVFRAVTSAVEAHTGAPLRAPDRIPAEAQVIVCAVVVLADWLASRSEFIRTRLLGVPAEAGDSELLSFLESAVAVAGDEVDRAGLTRLQLRDGSFAEEFPEFDQGPNRLQQSLDTELPGVVAGPGILLITEETGRGKTEAAWFAARILGEAAGTAGLAYLLPTMATSNAMETRLQKILDRRSCGEARLNLVHAMAWLRTLRGEKPEPVADVSDLDEMLKEVSDWLAKGRKTIHAPVCVATIDQALLSVLPLRHSAFRLLGFANKTIVIDEVHAFDAYVRGLLRGFLAWCGHLGVPVVLMSATLPRPIAHELVAAYLAEPELPEFTVPYPGWAFFSRDMPKEPKVRGVQVDDAERHSLEVDVLSCPTSDRGLERLPALKQALGPLCVDFGHAAVICTTIDEAQQTRDELAAWVAEEDSDVDVMLLHAREPIHQRDSDTERIIEQFGKVKPRPGRTIIVSTQVIEQSLDIDMDLIISDLAPFELLIQRAGRGHRHSKNRRHRPSWAAAHRLVVLSPEGGADPQLPERWLYVYPEASLIRAQRLLLRESGAGIQYPEGVQRLVDEVYTDGSLIAGHEGADEESRAREHLLATEAARLVVPTPGSLESVAQFSRAGAVPEERISTRFNADAVRVLPCFRREGELFLDAEATMPMPKPLWWPQGRAVWDLEAVALMVEHTLPLRRSQLGWTSQAVPTPFKSWLHHRHLREVVPLIHTVEADGTVRPARIGGRTFRLDAVLGLVIAAA